MMKLGDYGPEHLSKANILKAWEAWLPANSPWLKAMRAAPDNYLYYDWGCGLPGRKHGLLPFCMSAEAPDGREFDVTLLRDLKKLSATAKETAP